MIWDRHPKCKLKESETNKLKRVGRTWRIDLTAAVWLVELEYAAVFCLAAWHMDWSSAVVLVPEAAWWALAFGVGTVLVVPVNVELEMRSHLVERMT